MVKRCKIKRGSRSLAVDGIKINFCDNDDHTTKYYCCLTLTSSRQQATMSVCHFAEWMEPVRNILQDAKMCNDHFYNCNKYSGQYVEEASGLYPLSSLTNCSLPYINKILMFLRDFIIVYMISLNIDFVIRYSQRQLAVQLANHYSQMYYW